MGIIYSATVGTEKWNNGDLVEGFLTKDTLLNRVICVSDSQTLKNQSVITDWIVIDVDTQENNIREQLRDRNITYFRRPSTNWSPEKNYKYHYIIPVIGESRNQDERKRQYQIAMNFLNLKGYDITAGQATRVFSPSRLPENEKAVALEAHRGETLKLSSLRFDFIPPKETKEAKETKPLQDQEIIELLKQIPQGDYHHKYVVGCALKHQNKKELYLWWCQDPIEKKNKQYDKYPVGHIGALFNMVKGKK